MFYNQGKSCNALSRLYVERPLMELRACQSGNGRDKSLHALDKYTEMKTTWISLA